MRRTGRRTWIWLLSALSVWTFAILFSLSVSADGATVVYLRDGGTGDGSSAAQPVGSLTAAYEALDLSKDCTIVVSGVFTQSSAFSWGKEYSGSVTLTSVWDGTDYRQSGAKYAFKPCRFVCFGDTRMEYLDFVGATSTTTNILFIGQHHPITVGYGCTMTAPAMTGGSIAKAFCLLGGYQDGQDDPPQTDGRDTNITVLSGSSLYIVPFSRNIAGSYTGTARIKIGGDAHVSVLHGSAAYPSGVTVGNVEAEITDDAVIDNFYGCTQDTHAGSFSLVWRSGRIGLFEWECHHVSGTFSYMTDGTRTLYASDTAAADDRYAEIAALFDTTVRGCAPGQTVYLCDGGTGDGSSAAHPVGTLASAYDALDLSRDCTVVLCGEYPMRETFSYGQPYTGSVTLTSRFGGRDYREENGAALLPDDVRFVCFGDTTFEHIDFMATADAFLLIGQHHSVTLGDGCHISGPSGMTGGSVAKSFCILGGYQSGQDDPPTQSDADVHITVRSGRLLYVIPFSRNIAGNYSGTAYVSIGGDADVVTFLATAAYPSGVKVGRVDLELRDSARIRNFYGCTQSTTAQSVTLFWRSGSIDVFEWDCRYVLGEPVLTFREANRILSTAQARANANYARVANCFDMEGTLPDGGNGFSFDDASIHVHTYGEWVTERAATATAAGSRVRICTGCQAEAREEIPLLLASLCLTDVSAVSGGRVTLSLSLAENPGIGRMEIQLAYETAHLSFVSCDANELCGAVCYAAENDTGVRLVCDLGDGNATGTLATLSFRLSEDAAGELSLTLSDDSRFIGIDGDGYGAALFGGKILAAAPERGDFDRDGLVSNSDMVPLIRCLAGWQTDGASLDYDGNGKTDNRDAIRFSQTLAGWFLPEPTYRRLSVRDYEDKTRAGFLSQLVGFFSGYEFARNPDGTPRLAMPDSWFEMLNGPYAEPNSHNRHEDKLLFNAETGLWEAWNDDDFSIDILNQYILRDSFRANGAFSQKAITDGWAAYDVYDMGGGHRSNGAYALMSKYGYLPAFAGSAEFGNIYTVNGEPYIENETLGMVCAAMPDTAAELSSVFASVTSDQDPALWARFFATMYSLAYFENDIPTLIREAEGVLPDGCYQREVIDDVFALKDRYGSDWRSAVIDADAACFRYHDGMESRMGETSVNCSFILIGLLFGDGDYTETCKIISLAGHGGDSTTPVGLGIVGIINGTAALPSVVNEKLWQNGEGVIVNRPAPNTAQAYWMCMMGLPERIRIADIVDMYRENFENVLLSKGGRIEDGVYLIPTQTVGSLDTVYCEDFETGLGGWTAQSGSISEGEPFTGNTALRLNGCEYEDSDACVTLTGLIPGATYRVNAYLRTGTGMTVYLYAEAPGRNDRVTAAVSDQPMFVRRTFVFTATASAMRLGVLLPEGFAPHRYAILDDIDVCRIEEAPVSDVSFAVSDADGVYTGTVTLRESGKIDGEVYLRLVFANTADKSVPVSVKVNGIEYGTAALYRTGKVVREDGVDVVYIPILLPRATNSIKLALGTAKIPIRSAEAVRIRDRF